MAPFEECGEECSDENSIAIIKVLSRVLTRLIDINVGNSSSTIRITAPGSEVFESSSCPPISIDAYLLRIQKYAKCSSACFIVALIYIDRLIELRNVTLSSLNVHRIIITSVLLATKSLDDVSYNNSYFAKLGGLPPREMNSLEAEFLSLVKYSLFVLPEAYDKYYGELRNFSASPMQSISWAAAAEEKQQLLYEEARGGASVRIRYSVGVAKCQPAYAQICEESHSFFSKPLASFTASATASHQAQPQAPPLGQQQLQQFNSFFSSDHMRPLSSNAAYTTAPSNHQRPQPHPQSSVSVARPQLYGGGHAQAMPEISPTDVAWLASYYSADVSFDIALTEQSMAFKSHRAQFLGPTDPSIAIKPAYSVAYQPPEQNYSLKPPFQQLYFYGVNGTTEGTGLFPFAQQLPRCTDMRGEYFDNSLLNCAAFGLH